MRLRLPRHATIGRRQKTENIIVILKITYGDGWDSDSCEAQILNRMNFIYKYLCKRLDVMVEETKKQENTGKKEDKDLDVQVRLKASSPCSRGSSNLILVCWA